MAHIFRRDGGTGGIERTSFSCERDGLVIRGEQWRPQGLLPPVAIVSHGFMANLTTVRHYAHHLAELGFAAFCFDFNGGSALRSQSDGATTDMSVLTEVDDLLAVVSFTQELTHVDASRMLLMGCSQGGFVSALVAAQLKEQVGGLALFYPAFCIPDDARAGKMMFARFDPADVPGTFRCGPMRLGRRYVTDVQAMDPFAEIAPYPGHVLIVQGTKDRVVDPSYATRARDSYAARTASRWPDASVELYMIEDGAHGFSRRHDRQAIAILDGFARQLLK